MFRPSFLIALLVLALVPVPPASASGCSPTPVNDCVASALEWRAKPEYYSNTGATMEPGEPSTCAGATVHNSVWLKLEVLAPGTSDQFRVDLNAPFLATLGIYDRALDGTLAQLSCNKSWIDPEDQDLYQPSLWPACSPGKTYWIQVGAQSPSQSGSFQISESRFWHFNMTLSQPCPFKATLPTEPRLNNPVGGNGQVSLSWTEPWWSGGRDVEITSYRVYRASTCAGSFSFVGATPHRSFVDGGLPAGASRCYRVTAVNVEGEGPAEPGRLGTTWSAPRAPPSLAVARGGDGELRLTWSASPDQGGPAPMTAYKVYRAASASGPFVLIATTTATATSHTDAGLGRGTTAHYRVSAVNVVGEGATSTTASATTWAVPGVPRDVSAQARVGLTSLESQITWSPPADPSPFTHYRIYRASSSAGAPQFIGEVSSGITSFVDRNRVPFDDQYYEVRASNPAGEGAASARACVVHPFNSALARCS